MKARLLLIWPLAALLLAGCINTAPRLRPDITPPPVVTPTPEPTPTPTPTPTPEPTPTPTPEPTPMLMDALGEPILDTAHFERYISFKNIQVYEQAEDTFVDCVAQNAYPESLVCALDMVFYEEGEEVARGKLQTRNAQYLLVLQPGETVLFAQVDTDMALTALEFRLVFDPARAVMPE